MLVCLLSIAAGSQRIGIITPQNNAEAEKYVNAISEALGVRAIILDRSLVQSAFVSQNIEKPFNLAIGDAKRLASAIGCDYLLIVRAETLRRASFSRDDYFEAFAALYLVSGRTGRLVKWQLKAFEEGSQAKADAVLLNSSRSTSNELVAAMHTASEGERTEPSRPSIEEVPGTDSPAAKNLRPPVPYRRIKPEYTQSASLYNVLAVVEIEVDIAATGEVTRTEIVRWAGFGLDESVLNTVRTMNWRPAMRDGKPLPMRVLLRYNFLKVEKE
jgi:TonB-like protein